MVGKRQQNQISIILLMSDYELTITQRAKDDTSIYKKS